MKFGFFIKFQDPPAAANMMKNWEENFQMAKVGEQLGFDGCFTAEHHLIPDGYNPAPLVTLAALARETKRLKLGTAILQLPFYHPIQVAEQSSMVDILSGGRLTLGVGISGVEREFKTFGRNVREQASLLDEGIELLRRSWTEDNFSFYGRHYNLKNITVTPKPTQKPHPPLWLGGMSEAGMRRAGRFGLTWVTDPMNKPETLKKWVEVYRDTSTARGNKPRVALWRDGWVTKNKKEAETAERTWYAPIRADRWFYYSSFPGRAWGGGVKGDPAIAVETWLQKAKSIEDFKYDFLKPSLVVGTVDEVVDQIERYRKDLKMEYLILRSRFGAGPTLERSLETMKLFAKEVMPHFRE